LITSIGVRQSSVWLKDATGDRRLPVEGSASQPVFSADGRRLYYLVKKANSADSIELWARDLASGKSDPILTGQKIVDYDISPDQKNVVFTVGTGSAMAIFMAAVDRGSAPRLLTKDGDSVSFTGATDVVFRQLGEKASYLARIHTDGTGLERITETPIAGKMGNTSPDGEWAVTSGLTDPSKVPGTYAVSLRDGSRRDLCQGACLVKWSLDGRFLFVTLARAPSDARISLSIPGRTLVIPLPRGLTAAAIPEAGFNLASDAFNGIQVIRQEQISPGFDANTYAYTTAEFQGNLFRIPLH
jgi:hypothetical protein